ncbi:MAG TPA: mechanosensitive ion channel family protein [Polyangiales bacterium]|nr:mechanosensitive ion channel family protein [Polyangiales bacterium]
MFEKLWNAVARGEGIALIAAVVLVGLGLAFALRATVAGPNRSRLRAPALLLIAAAGVWLVMEVWSPSPANRRLMRVVPMLLVLLAFGRLATVALFDWALSRRLRRDAPRIVRDIAEGVIAIVALMIALNAAGVEAVPLVTTSAVITAILGLSLQDTLGNLFAGLALQAQRPFELGEWIQIDPIGMQVGRVVEMNWRATKVLTADLQELNIPNGQLARTPILNLSRPGSSFRRAIDVVLPYEHPPRRCCEVIERALLGIAEVLPAPAPTVVTQAFLDQGIRYRIVLYVGQFGHRDMVDALVRERLWYALRRAGIPIARGAGISFGAPEQDAQRDFATRVRAIRQIDFLRDLPDSAVETFAADAHTEVFAPGEVVVRQGEVGEEAYLCLSGELVVLLRVEGGEQCEIARITQGGLFGEFAQVTGEARAATVQAVRVCELAVIGRRAFRSVLGKHPEFADSISQRLAERRAELDAAGQAVTPSTRPSVDEQKGQFLRRLREFLAL